MQVGIFCQHPIYLLVAYSYAPGLARYLYDTLKLHTQQKSLQIQNIIDTPS